MTFTLQNFDVFLLILVRITGFVFSAPFFSLPNVPQRVKAGFSLLFAVILFQVIPASIQYSTVIEFGGLIIKEVLVGLILGFFTNACYHILNFAGQLIDMEIGLSMVNQLDPVSNVQSTITANLYSYVVILILLVTNFHHYLITAFVDTYKVIPLGEAKINPNIYLLMLDFIKNYFIIGFRIILPIFSSMLIVNAILAILAKVAPQMNMFVIGLQLKIIVGLVILYLLVRFMPTVSSFIFDEMMRMMKLAIDAMS
ncbi:MAG: putative rane protein [Anaerocolumna sp.]|jgi:flagellar biosynthetic protein FliR|nr:putative rane protein [Anaerocolumna sp.]